VERWRSDCGCTTGGHPGWNQQWRGPLREALDGLKASLDRHYFDLGPKLFKDPKAALLDYGMVLAGMQTQKAFAARHCHKQLDHDQRQAAWRLLSMQQWGLASFASCAWFFDEISRIEPVNGLTYALRAMQLCEATGGPKVAQLEAALIQILDRARSNFPELGTGKDIYESMIRPRQEGPASLVTQALLALEFQGREPRSAKQSVSWSGVQVSVKGKTDKAGKKQESTSHGSAAIFWSLEHKEDEYVWRWRKDSGGDPLQGVIQVAQKEKELDAAPEFKPLQLPWNKLQSLALTMATEVERQGWQEQEQRLRASAHMFLPYQEAQTTQNLETEWRRHWPVMAWLYVQGLDLPREDEAQEHGAVRHGSLANLRGFLAVQGKGHPDAELVGRRIVAHVEELLGSEPPLWHSAIKVVERAQELELEVNWWPVQNRLWRQGKPEASDKPAQKLAGLLGFKV